MLVELPDGRTAEFPDDMPREQIKQIITQKFPDAYASPKPAQEQPTQQDTPQRSFGGGALASLTGAVDAIPVVGPLLQKGSDFAISQGAAMFGGGDAGEIQRGLEERRAANQQNNPEATIAGKLTGAVGSVGALGATAAGANALGLTGSLGTRVANSAMSSQGLFTADQLARGEQGTDTLGYGIPALAGAAAPLAAEGVKAVGKGISNAVTANAQRGMTRKAVEGAATSKDLKTVAVRMFEESKSGNIGVKPEAFSRLYRNVQKSLAKIRPTEGLDEAGIGALKMLRGTLDDVMQPGSNVVPDIQDLHILRQAAQKVAMSAKGRDEAIGNIIVNQIDDFVRTMKPADIAGSSDPKAAAKALMDGISTWSKASKVATIEEAIRVGELAASGPQNGIQNTFRALLKNKNTIKLFNKAEVQAITDVANGTFLSNSAKFIGKGGVGAGGNSWLGTMVTGALGANVGGPYGSALAIGGASLARKGAELMTRDAANVAGRAAATSGVPIAQQAPNLLAPAAVPLEYLLKSAPLASSGGSNR